MKSWRGGEGIARVRIGTCCVSVDGVVRPFRLGGGGVVGFDSLLRRLPVSCRCLGWLGLTGIALLVASTLNVTNVRLACSAPMVCTDQVCTWCLVLILKQQYCCTWNGLAAAVR